jgi:hypothetical protein
MSFSPVFQDWVDAGLFPNRDRSHEATYPTLELGPGTHRPVTALSYSSPGGSAITVQDIENHLVL